MANRDEILAYADDLLNIAAFPEFAPAGAQVLGAEEVSRIACGVSSSRELFRRAGEWGAQLVLVHHGLFWRNEPLLVDRRLRGRLEELFAADLTLVAYHLALDAHPELGNNVQLARALGIEVEQPFATLGVGGRLPEPVSLEAFVERVRTTLDRDPLVFAEGPDPLRRVALVTGGGGSHLIEAARAGYDLFLTGEPEEPSLQTARELGISFVAAGHHATERLGVQALAQKLAERFGVEWEFIEVPNPV